jgi:hypothetical protein
LAHTDRNFPFVSKIRTVEVPGTTARSSVELAVPAHVAYERLCRHRWELSGAGFIAEVDERRPDELLRWHAVGGPVYRETLLVQPLSARRSRVTATATGEPGLVATVGADLSEFKRRIEGDPRGHHLNERPATDCRHRSNWRDSLVPAPAPTPGGQPPWSR